MLSFQYFFFTEFAEDKKQTQKVFPLNNPKAQTAKTTSIIRKTPRVLLNTAINEYQHSEKKYVETYFIYCVRLNIQ